MLSWIEIEASVDFISAVCTRHDTPVDRLSHDSELASTKRTLGGGAKLNIVRDELVEFTGHILDEKKACWS